MKTLIALFLFCGLQVAAQDMQSCPMLTEQMKAAQQRADVGKNGDEAMGFPHDKTTHHLRLNADGGAIEVTVNDRKDTQDDFSLPMFVHSQVPPGVPVMKEKRAVIFLQLRSVAGRWQGPDQNGGSRCSEGGPRFSEVPD